MRQLKRLVGTGALPRWLALAAVVAVALAAAVLLTVRPWSGGPPVEEAAAHPADYGICNVSVRNIPEGVRVGGVAWPETMMQMVPNVSPAPSGHFITLMLSMPMPEGQHYRATDPDTGELVDLRTRVVIDAQSGELLFENYRTAAEEAKLEGLLATLSVGPWEPVGPAWPHTNTPPQGDKKDIHKPVAVAADHGKVMLRYHPPERGSGLLTGEMWGDSFTDLRAYTCESEMVIDARTGNVTRDQVAPGEKAMFRRFLEEVVTP